MLIIGNLIQDHIWELDSFRKDNSNKASSYKVELGGVINYLSSFDYLGKDSKFLSFIGTNNSDLVKKLSEEKYSKLSTIEIGGNSAQANIIAETGNNTRSSIVDWGVYQKKIPSFILESNEKNIHLAYIDTMCLSESFFEYVRNNDVFLSADFCGADIFEESTQYLHKSLKYLSILFISDNHYEDINKSFGNILEDKLLVIHGPQKTILKKGNDILEVKNEYLISCSGLNVLGAGDFFASSFLSEANSKGILRDKENINISYFKEICENSQKNTTNWLKHKNNLQ